MRFINQPRGGVLGEELQEILNHRADNGFEFFYIIVAYVKKSGVTRLQPHMEQFKRDGGKIKAVVGISQKNTSFQGLKLLLPICDEIYVYHNEIPDYTFHPKIYFFEKEGEKAVAFIGSSNLTAGGLYGNYEANMSCEYDLTNRDDADEFQKIKSMFSSYSDTSSPCCKKLTPEFLQQIKTEYLSDEEEETRRMPSRPSSLGTGRQKVFGSETFRIPKAIVTKKLKKPAIVPPAGIGKPPTRGRLVWAKKNLPPSDVQHYKEGTNPTGGLRLTQAWWKVDGRGINQTTYFRDDLFGGFNWKIEKSSPFVEVAEVLFNFKILGKNRGVHQLKIRHKPSGEASQGNYTTLLSWGKLGGLIEKLNLVGRDFLLYAPLKGKKEPFYIEII